MRIAALIKQVPAFEEMELGSDGRLKRDGLELAMNPYCQRAVAQAVELAGADDAEHSVTFVTLGPPSAEEVLREALAWALERRVRAEGVLVTDAAFAGSDTLATARALAAALKRIADFDVVLVGKNSVDADTGQVGPQLAELLDLPFLSGVRQLHLDRAKGLVHAHCEHDDGWVRAETFLPAVLSTAERLIAPCKVGTQGRQLVPKSLLRHVTAAELGPGPWGAAGSATTVGPVRVHEVTRERTVLTGAIDEQARRAVDRLVERQAFGRMPARVEDAGTVPPPRPVQGPAVVVVVEPNRPLDTRELLGVAALLATEIEGHVRAVTFEDDDVNRLGMWGADTVMQIEHALVEDDAARALGDSIVDSQPWGVLAPSTAWGREVAARAAARSEAGLTGDAVDLAVDPSRLRLVAWKPAFGGQLIAAVEATSAVQMATVRAGVLPVRCPRDQSLPEVSTVTVTPRSRVRVLARTRDDDLDTLAGADAVIGVGLGVDPSEYDALSPLLGVLRAELGATRKVTDAGWLPRARQIGITGRSIAPRLFVSIGASGKFNHMVGVRGAHTVLAINSDPEAPVFQAADIGIVADWRAALPELVGAITQAQSVNRLRVAVDASAAWDRGAPPSG